MGNQNLPYIWRTNNWFANCRGTILYNLLRLLIAKLLLGLHKAARL